MKPLLYILSVFLLSAFLYAGETQITPLDAIQSKGSITISDGSSFYTFRKDGSFESGPCGFSGRTISGKWHLSENRPNRLFVVDGRWGWINGLSRSGDFRKIVFDIRPGTFRKTSSQEQQFTLGAEIFQCYFLIDELIPQAKK